MYASTFVYVYLRIPLDLQREILSYVPTRRQSFMNMMEGWTKRCYPNDSFQNITEDEEWEGDDTTRPRSLGISIVNDPDDSFNVHRFRSLPLREYIVWRKSSDDVFLGLNHQLMDEYMDRNTFYVATYRKMQASIRRFNEMAKEGTKVSWLKYQPIRWNDATMKFVDPWYATSYYVCWRRTLYHHIVDQMM